ncbi:MAG TPA: phage holin family protein [Nostocaceae cyanobacterium]|nr:phage holin family protein [Nostocaceae cyanobacterium]
MNIVTLLIVWIVTSISLWLISKLPLGVEFDTPKKAFISAAVLGIITAIIKPLLKFLFSIPNLMTVDFLSSIFTFMIGVICFCLAAAAVEGFRLRFGIWSAILGSLALTFINNLIYRLLGV